MKRLALLQALVLLLTACGEVTPPESNVRIPSPRFNISGPAAAEMTLSPIAGGRYFPGFFDQAGFVSVGQGQAGWYSFNISQLAGSHVCDLTFSFTQVGTTNPSGFPLTINMYDVSTSFDRLMVDRIPIDAEGEGIASDLHTGKVYASFQVTAAGEGAGYEIAVNDLGIGDLQAAIGGGEQFFSIGLANASFDNLGYFTPANASLRASVDCVIEVPIDIRPQSCPNPLNSKDKGIVPVAILGSSTLDVTKVDASTVTLEGVPALRSALEDVATPFNGTLEDSKSCTSLGPDGVMDLSLKFDAQSLVAALGLVSDGESRQLQLNGKLKAEFGRTEIRGADIVRIVQKP